MRMRDEGIEGLLEEIGDITRSYEDVVARLRKEQDAAIRAALAGLEQKEVDRVKRRISG